MLRSNLIGTQQRVSGYYVKGVHFGTERAQSVVGAAVDLATKGVSIVAANAERFDRAANLNALDTLNRVVLPAAHVVSMVAERIEEGSSKLVRRVAGKPVPAKAVATRKLNAATRKAAATRKRVTKTATKRVSKAVAENRHQDLERCAPRGAQGPQERLTVPTARSARRDPMHPRAAGVTVDAGGPRSLDGGGAAEHRQFGRV